MMVVEDFITKDQRQYQFRIGTLVASSLAGFIAGVLFGGVAVWLIFWAASQNQ